MELGVYDIDFDWHVAIKEYIEAKYSTEQTLPYFNVDDERIMLPHPLKPVVQHAVDEAMWLVQHHGVRTEHWTPNMDAIYIALGTNHGTYLMLNHVVCTEAVYKVVDEQSGYRKICQTQTQTPLGLTLMGGFPDVMVLNPQTFIAAIRWILNQIWMH